jgi:hypothetical protein
MICNTAAVTGDDSIGCGDAALFLSSDRCKVLKTHKSEDLDLEQRRRARRR